MSTRCPTPTKSRYATHTAAAAAAGRVSLHADAAIYPYECACTWWHLSRKTPDTPIDPAHASLADIELLASLPDIDFRDVVAHDAVGEGDPGQRAALRHHRNQIRWRRHLGQLIGDVEKQLRDRRGDPSLAGHDWAKRATTYRDQLTIRLTECRRLRAADHAQTLGKHEQRRRDTEVAAAAGATVKELRAAAGELAIQRLIAAHGTEFSGYVAEEFRALGLSVPARVQRYEQAGADITPATLSSRTETP